MKWLTAATDEDDGGLKEVLPFVSAATSLYKDDLSFGRWGSVELRGIDLLRDISSLIFIVSIAFVPVIAIYLILIVFIMNGNAIWN